MIKAETKRDKICICDDAVPSEIMTRRYFSPETDQDVRSFRCRPFLLLSFEMVLHFYQSPSG